MFGDGRQMMKQNHKIRLGVLLNYTSEAPFMIELARSLHNTGEVEPSLVQGRDRAEYPACEFPLIQFKDRLADSMQATMVIPYPGTPLFAYCQKNNLLLTTDWDDYDMRQPVMKSPISPEKQLQLLRELFYGVLTPKFLWYKITSIRNLSDIKFLANYAVKYIEKLRDFK